jgi:dTDP-4-amino-4,6-dideoxygalactose transaminase
MKLRRAIPPAAAPISLMDFAHGLYGIVKKGSVAELEREIREYFGTKYVFLVSSGKAALFLILSGLKKLSGKNKVIVPAYTCFSVPSAIRLAGLEIVPCDIRPETLDYDYSGLGNLIDDDTLCILSTHLFGIPSDVAKIRVLCGEKGIPVVEDAAQAMGAEYKNSKLGTLGDVAFFSLGRGKNITCGSGGIIITSAENIARSIRECFPRVKRVPILEYMKDMMEILFLMIFLHPSLYWFPKSLPFLRIGDTRFHWTFPVRGLTGFKAGLLYDWRGKLESFNRSRSAIADYYIRSLGLRDRMPIYSDAFAFLRFPMYLNGNHSKDALCESGNSLGISPMYPSPINEIREIKECFGNSKYAGAEKIADTLVALPTHVLLNEKDKWTISEAVRGAACI